MASVEFPSKLSTVVTVKLNTKNFSKELASELYLAIDGSKSDAMKVAQDREFLDYVGKDVLKHVAKQTKGDVSERDGIAQRAMDVVYQEADLNVESDPPETEIGVDIDYEVNLLKSSWSLSVPSPWKLMMTFVFLFGVEIEWD